MSRFIIRDRNVIYINRDINAMDYVIIETLLKARFDVQ